MSEIINSKKKKWTFLDSLDFDIWACNFRAKPVESKFFLMIEHGKSVKNSIQTSPNSIQIPYFTRCYQWRQQHHNKYSCDENLFERSDSDK
jgi:hypothetical protein